MNKSYVSLEMFIDPITGEKHNYEGGILLDERLKDSMEKETIVGHKYSEDTQNKLDNNFIALIEVDPHKSGILKSTETLKPSEAHRTGNIAWLKKEVASDLFNVEINTNMVFIEPEVFDYLQKQVEQ